ncbi:putative methyltransferase tdiE [Colletotrichum sp. SAR 10_86]|nr:putative methyltransferase tdiE [Colletotrichum sp. SAR 10_86]
MYQAPESNEVQVAIDEASVASSTTSLRPSLRDYREENGRTYHQYKDGKYNLPNDDRELDRQDLEHQLWLLSLDDRLGLAPPCQPNAKVDRVLDVGTGTGIWALNYGDEHPEAEVYGNDLSPVQPGHVPPNVRFEVDDVEDEWTFSRPFSYIHSRVMTSSIGDWRLYLRRCFDNLEPGGWLELQELDCVPRSDDGTLTPESPLNKWADLLVDASEKFGRPYVRIPPLKDMMIEIGFEDVSIYMHKWPTNSWPKDLKFKELGMWQNQSMMEGLEGFTMAPLTRALDWKKDEVNVFLIDVRKEINNRDVHAYWPIYFIMGRKPFKAETPAPA